MTAWDDEYKLRGRMWGGAAGSLPDLLKGSLVLECGCGNGKTLFPMQAKGWNVVGVDFSSEAVRLCGGSAVLGDVRRLPFPDDFFDAVFCWHVLGHLLSEDRKAAGTEILRVTKPCGRVFFKGFSRNDLRYGKGKLVEEHTFLKGDGVFTHYFDDCSLHEVFGEGEVYVTSWKMRVLGEEYQREELCGIFRK